MAPAADNELHSHLLKFSPNNLLTLKELFCNTVDAWFYRSCMGFVICNRIPSKSINKDRDRHCQSFYVQEMKVP